MSGGKQKTETKQDNSIDPWTKAQYDRITPAVREYTDSKFTPFTGDRVAGLDPLELQAADYFTSNMGEGLGFLDEAAGYARDAAGYAPQAITPGGSAYLDQAGGMASRAGNYQPERVDAGSFSDVDMSAYMNPYTGQVVDAALSDIERARSAAINSSQQDAAAAGAFGGSRHGVADSLTNEAALRQAASTGATLRNQAFNTAAGLAMADLDRGFSADAANAELGLSANSQRLGAAGLLGELGTGEANRNLQAQAMNEDNRYRGEALGVTAAGLLGDLGRTRSDMASKEAFAMQAFGENARNIDQAELDAAYEQYLLKQQDERNKAQTNLGLLGVTPTITDSVGTGTTQSNPGMLGILGTLVGGAASLGWQPFGGK